MNIDECAYYMSKADLRKCSGVHYVGLCPRCGAFSIVGKTRESIPDGCTNRLFAQCPRCYEHWPRVHALKFAKGKPVVA